ncbi:cytochrome aa3 quinol oxidase subunit IV [Cohnella boryungensis]|uniref:Quinol oxidase subunit 4 n=1 Tax=Cohnella boryungensis TaxID=768479 RepID=A0ABV8SIC5_9BACL
MVKPETSPIPHRQFPWKHLLGYLFSIVLTFISIWVAFDSGLPLNIIMIVIYIFAFLQAVLQLLMFMHMTEMQAKIQTGTMLFALFIAITVVAGSVWVMSSGHS